MTKLSGFEFWLVTVVIVGAATVIWFSVGRFVKSVDALNEAVAGLKAIVSSILKGQEVMGMEIKNLKITSDTHSHDISVLQERMKVSFRLLNDIKQDNDELAKQVCSIDKTVSSIVQMHKVNHNQNLEP